MSRVFSLFFIVIALIWGSAHANEKNFFLVENIFMSTDLESPNESRTKAIEDARRYGLIILLQRLKFNEAIESEISDAEIAQMVRSQQIENERIAKNNYSANFNILFDKDFIKHFFEQKKQEQLERKEKSHLIIPVKMQGFQADLWESDFRNSIIENLDEERSRKLEIASEEFDSDILNFKNITKPTYSLLKPIIKRKNVASAYVTFFSYDELENKVNLTIINVRDNQTKKVKLGFINANQIEYDILLDKISNKTIEYILGLIQKQKYEKPGLLKLQIPIDDFGDWLNTKNRIENTNLVNKINIESISKDRAVISLNYIDPKIDIVKSFKEYGLFLNKKSDSLYILTK